MYPYLSLIKWIGAVLILAFMFVSGCMYGGRNDALLEQQIQTLTDVNAEWTKAAKTAQKNVEANKKFAAEQEALAEQAAKEVDKLKKESAERQEQFEEQLRKADKEPTCAELLERELCPLLSLPSRP